MPDIVSGYTFVDGEKGVTANKLNSQISGAVIQTDFIANKPSSATLDPTDQMLELKAGGTYARITGAQLSSSVAGQLTLANTTQNGMMKQISGNTTDLIDGTNNSVPIATAIGPSVQLVRLRSFNSVGNPNFEVDQRNVGTNVGLGSAGYLGSMVCDRVFVQKQGTMTLNTQQVAGATPISIPGTNFAISRAIFQVTLTAVEATLAATDYILISQQIEGPLLRELISDVHSVSVLAFCTKALQFGLNLQDSNTTHSLTHLCSIAANTWTLIKIPAIPVWPVAGNFPFAPGGIGYLLRIVLACGSTYLSPANDAWQNGNFYGAAGMGNFAGLAVNDQFNMAFVQHEPGPLCTQLMDLDFPTNLDRCQRYYQKSYGYGIKPGTVTNNGAPYGIAAASNWPVWHVPFKRVMAKIPIISAYSPATGAGGNVRDLSANTDRTATSAFNAEDSGFEGFQTSTTNAASVQYNFHYVADVGW